MRSALILPVALLIAGTAHAQTQRTEMLAGFERVRVDGPFVVTVTTGTRGKATINGARDATERVAVRVENGTLIVSASQNAWGGNDRAARATVAVEAPVGTRGVAVRGGGTVSVDRLRGARLDLAVAGSGTLKVAEAQADQLYATLTGAGRIEVAGVAGRARFLSIGTGSVEARGLRVDDLAISQDSLGDGVFTARRTVTVSSAGLGSVTVEGDAACTVTVQRGGPVACKRTASR